jgi:hypothetical protein
MARITRISHRQALILATASVLTLVSIAHGQTYVGPANGNWDTPANWSPAGAPNSGSASVVVDNGQTVVIPDGVARSAGTLSIGPSAGSAVQVGSGSTLAVFGATHTNNGTIRLATNGSVSLLTINAPMTFGGTGTLVGTWPGTGPGPRIDAFANMLTLGANQTHSGVIFYNNARVTNNGLIDGNNASAASLDAGIRIDPSNQIADSFVNNATIRSSAGGLVTFVGDNGGNVLNNGTISATGAGSITELANSVSISGGTYATSTGGTVRVRPGNIGSIGGNVTISSGSTLLVPATSAQTTLNASGTINTGTLRLDAAGALSLLQLPGPLTLANNTRITGTYTNVSNSPGPRIDAFTHTLTINAGSVVEGVLYINNSRVINNGLIDANSTAGGMYVDPSNQAADLFVNNATMRSSNGGLMQITGDFGGSLLNNGTISAVGTGSTTELVNSVTVRGGTWSNSGGGVIRVRPGLVGSLISPTISTGSTFLVEPTSTSGQTTLNLSGTLNGPGVLELRSNNPGTNTPLMQMPGPVTVAGGATIRGTYATSGNGPRIDAFNHDLTIAPGGRIEGVVYFQNSRVINNGLIDANNPAGMYVDASNSGGGPFFINNSTMRSSSGGLLMLTGDFGGNFLNNATISSTGAGSITELVNNVTVVGGTWTNSSDGTVRVRPGMTATLVNPTISAGSTFVVEATSSSGSTYLNLGTSLSGPGILELRSTNPGSNRPVLRINENVTLNSGSTVFGGYGTTGNGASIEAFGNPLTIASGATIRGVVYFNNSRIINNGTILSDNPVVPNTVGSFGMFIDANNSTGQPHFVNNGTIRATNGASLGFTGDFGGAFGGTGPLIVDANSVIGTWNSASGDMGPVSGAGTYRAGNSANLGHTHFRVGTLEAVGNGIARVTAGGGNAGTSRVNTVALSSNGRIDLTDNGMVVTAMTETQVRSLLAAGRAGGAWNGFNGIGSSLALNNGRGIGAVEASLLGVTSFLGQPANPTDLLLRYTFEGDTNLDAMVNFGDLLALAQNYEPAVTGKVWFVGDFNYDGRTDFDDLLILAQNYGTSLLSDGSTHIDPDLAGSLTHHWAVARSLVPEPAAVGLIVTVGVIVLKRRDV